MRLAGYPLISAGEAFRALIPAAAQGPAADIRLKVSTVRLGSNRRTLTAEFAGAAAGTGPCTADYRLELAESRTAVVVGILEHDHAGGMSCAAVGYPRRATAVLLVPLGARVVVDAVSGTAIAVTEAPPRG